jgi:hypothetical protein
MDMEDVIVVECGLMTCFQYDIVTSTCLSNYFIANIVGPSNLSQSNRFKMKSSNLEWPKAFLVMFLIPICMDEEVGCKSSPVIMGMLTIQMLWLFCISLLCPLWQVFISLALVHINKLLLPYFGLFVIALPYWTHWLHRIGPLPSPLVIECLLCSTLTYHHCWNISPVIVTFLMNTLSSIAWCPSHFAILDYIWGHLHLRHFINLPG